MARINLLDRQVAELIAAGEVVERPASIVKELVENAVDAGSTAVTVEIQNGGVSYIRVTDNGSGIEREDVSTAFLRHATSKVKVSEDLDSIMTMGFRGEALASVAAMCKVEMLTRTADEIAGTRYVIWGGEQQALEDAGCPVGTTIMVRDVFYNTPARMKFLKKDVSEGNSVGAVVEKIALAYPDVAFIFIRDGVQKLQTFGDGKLISAIRCTMGRAFSESVVEVSYTLEGLTLTGFISTPQASRGSRALQIFFINQRFIRSKTCMAALEEAFRGALMVGRFPSCVLNLSIPAQTVDVNVHPAKTEVRFSDEKSIFSLVHYGCKTALGAADLTPRLQASDSRRAEPSAQQRISAEQYRALTQEPTPVMHERIKVGERVEWKPSPMAATPTVSRQTLDIQTPVEPPKLWEQPTATMSSPAGFYTPAMRATSSWRPVEFSSGQENKDEQPDMVHNPLGGDDPFDGARIIGELFETYIILQNKDELLLVDKHAAHERLLFNHLINGGLEEDRQILLAPIPVQLSADEYSVILDNLEMLSKAGLTVEDFGDNFVIIREVVPVLSGADLPAIITEFAEKLMHENKLLMSRQIIDLYHTVACRAAIKANDKTAAPTLVQLIALLREDADIKHCPHGRPVAIRLTKTEIEKKFGRLG